MEDIDKKVHMNNKIDSLTPQQKVILSMVAHGISNRAIAKVLGLKERTVINHLTGVYRVLMAGLNRKEWDARVYITRLWWEPPC
jgi:DNA-binding CsgD family transcriptional regulator